MSALDMSLVQRGARVRRSPYFDAHSRQYIDAGEPGATAAQPPGILFRLYRFTCRRECAPHPFDQRGIVFKSAPALFIKRFAVHCSQDVRVVLLDFVLQSMDSCNQSLIHHRKNLEAVSAK